VTGAKSVNLRAAKSVIDSLGMLKNKTAGNLTEHETKLIDTALKNLIPLYKTVLNDSEA
jgi:ribosomal protein S13